MGRDVMVRCVRGETRVDWLLRSTGMLRWSVEKAFFERAVVEEDRVTAWVWLVGAARTMVIDQPWRKKAALSGPVSAAFLSGFVRD